MEWGVIIMGLKIGCSCESILYCIGWMDINWCIYGRLRSFLFIVSRRKATLILQLQFMWCREGDVNSDVRLMPAIEKRTFTNSICFLFSQDVHIIHILHVFYISRLDDANEFDRTLISNGFLLWLLSSLELDQLSLSR